MSLLNWIAIALSIVLWIIGQHIGHGIGMASSAPIRDGSAEDIYLSRVGFIGGIVAIGSILTFISQLIPVPIVKTIGLIILTISILSVAILTSGLLRLRLPPHDVTAEEQLAILSRIQKRLASEGWTTRNLDNGTILWSRPEPQGSADTEKPEAEEDTK